MAPEGEGGAGLVGGISRVDSSVSHGGSAMQRRGGDLSIDLRSGTLTQHSECVCVRERERGREGGRERECERVRVCTCT